MTGDARRRPVDRRCCAPSTTPWHFGRALGERLRAGDLVILDGSLGAGKTTLTKGIAAGMGVTGG